MREVCAHSQNPSEATPRWPPRIHIYALPEKPPGLLESLFLPLWMAPVGLPRATPATLHLLWRGPAGGDSEASRPRAMDVQVILGWLQGPSVYGIPVSARQWRLPSDNQNGSREVHVTPPPTIGTAGRGEGLRAGRRGESRLLFPGSSLWSPWNARAWAQNRLAVPVGSCLECKACSDGLVCRGMGGGAVLCVPTPPPRNTYLSLR